MKVRICIPLAALYLSLAIGPVAMAHGEAPAALPTGLSKPNNPDHPGNAAFLKMFTALAAKNPQMAAAVATATQSTLAKPPAPTKPAPAPDDNMCKNRKPEQAKNSAPDALIPTNYNSTILLKDRLKASKHLPPLDKSAPKTWVFATVQGAAVGPALPSGKAAPVTVWPVAKVVGGQLSLPWWAGR